MSRNRFIHTTGPLHTTPGGSLYWQSVVENERLRRERRNHFWKRAFPFLCCTAVAAGWWGISRIIELSK